MGQITALVKSSTLVAMPTDASTGNPDTAKARSIEVSGAPTFSDSFETIERNVVRQAFSTYAPLRGLETTSGTITVELHGSGNVDAPPETALLYKSALGSLYTPAGVTDPWIPADGVIASTVGDLSQTNPVIAEVLDGSNQSYNPKLWSYTFPISPATTIKEEGFELNFPVRVYSDTELKIIGFITKIDETNKTITIVTEKDPNTVTLVDGTNADKVDCGFLFLLHKKYDAASDTYPQVLQTTEMNFDYFRGDIVKERWFKALATEFSIDLSTGQVCLPSFNWEGAEVGYSDDSYSPSDYTINTLYDSSNSDPLVVQLTDIYMAEIDEYTDNEVKVKEYFQDCISQIQITLTNEVFKKQCIASLGIGEVLRTSRAVTGSLNTFYTGKEFQEAFRAGNLYAFRSVFNYAKELGTNGEKLFTTEAGNIVAIAIPQLKFSEVSVSEDTGIFKYDTSFSCEPVRGDDELIIAFL
jgi:hypothetical protein